MISFTICTVYTLTKIMAIKCLVHDFLDESKNAQNGKKKTQYNIKYEVKAEL